MAQYKMTEYERKNRSRADALNAILSQSSIKEASESAHQRGREQAAARLQRSRSRDSRMGDLEVLAMKQAMDDRGGPFEGTSMEAQMLNIMRDPNADPEMRRLAEQRLGRSNTVVTPEGTHITPGYTFDGSAAPVDGYIPKPRTEGEKRGDYVTSNLGDLDAQATAGGSDQYTPSLFEGVVEAVSPEVFKGIFTSDQYKAQKGTADEWARTMVFLRSGATARQEEVDAAAKNFWPQVNDSPQDIARKAKMRAQAETTAKKAYSDRTGRPIDGKAEPGNPNRIQLPDGRWVVKKKGS